MCPERQLLSVYFDGELPDTWKEKMEAHLESCPECASLLERFKLCSEKLQKPLSIGMDDVKEHVWQRFSPCFNTVKPAPHVWSHTVTLPLPVAAAAAAVFIIVFVFAIIRPAVPVGQQDAPAMISMNNPVDLDVKSIVPASDMGSIFQYLEEENASDYMIIKLPESRKFTSTGGPEIVRAVDYSRRTGSQ
jgi:hypothetical protein